MTDMQVQGTANPLATDGFEFVEYTAPDAQGIQNLKDLFIGLGFTEVAKHKNKNVWLYRQGDINFVVNAEPNSHAENFAHQHGASVNGMAWRVKMRPRRWTMRLQLVPSHLPVKLARWN